MFLHKTPPTPTPTKKIIYLIAWVLLGVLLSFLICALLEIKFLTWMQGNNWAQENPGAVVFYDGNALPLIVHIGLIVIGALFGFWQGKVWWRKVYIERYWEKKLAKLK